MFPVPAVNPFRAVELTPGKGTTRPASRAEAYALHRALLAAGEPHLAAVPLICFEWHQRPELPLVARTGEPLFPELSAFLDTLERLMPPKPLGEQIPGTAKPVLLRTARTRVRRAAKMTGLPDWLTLAACRDGGLTELGDAELTEQGVMALSGHLTPDAARLYMKRTDVQREAALLKRRAWVQAITVEGCPAEQEVDKSRNRASAGE